MADVINDAVWVTPKGASPMAPDERIFAQVHPSYWRLWPASFLGVPLFVGAGVVGTVLTFVEQDPRDFGTFIGISLGLLGMGLLILFGVLNHCRTTRLTITNRRAIYETAGLARLTREIEWTPTVSVTLMSVNGFEEIVIEGGGRKISISAVPAAEELAESIATLREASVVIPPTTAPMPGVVLQVAPDEETSLEPDEMLLMRVRPRAKGGEYAPRGVVALFIGGALCALMWWAVPYGVGYVFLALAALTLVGSVLCFVGPRRYAKRTLLTVTNRRVILRTGSNADAETRELLISADLEVDWDRNTKFPEVRLLSRSGGISIRNLPDADALIRLMQSLGAELPNGIDWKSVSM